MTDNVRLAEAYRSLTQQKEHLQKQVAQVNAALNEVCKQIGEYMNGSGNTSLQLSEKDVLVLKTVEKTIPVSAKEHKEKLKEICWNLGITSESDVDCILNAKRGDTVQHQKFCVVSDGKTKKRKKIEHMTM